MLTKIANFEIINRSWHSNRLNEPSNINISVKHLCVHSLQAAIEIKTNDIQSIFKRQTKSNCVSRMSGDICYLCFEKSDQMKQNFQQSIQNMNIQEFAEHFCQFIFQVSAFHFEFQLFCASTSGDSIVIEIIFGFCRTAAVHWKKSV